MFKVLPTGIAALALSAPLMCPPAIGQDLSLSDGMVRGIVRPINQASIAIDMPVQVEKLHFREAERFKKGDKLVTFDCERLQAEFNAAEAVQQEMKLNFESQSYLDKRGAVGKLDLEISKVRFDKARSEAAALQVRLDKCVVIAPYDGRVTNLKINEHEMPATGEPFISIVDETAFEIDLIVPSISLRSLTAGTPFKFTVDETGKTYGAKVIRIGAVVDPISQTIKVIAALDQLDGDIIAGMSGSAILPGLGGSQ